MQGMLEPAVIAQTLHMYDEKIATAPEEVTDKKLSKRELRAMREGYLMASIATVKDYGGLAAYQETIKAVAKHLPRDEAQAVLDEMKNNHGWTPEYVDGIQADLEKEYEAQKPAQPSP
jgi:hypothetical protein